MSLITGNPNLLVFSPQLANEWYGVKGGDKVEILYFVANDTPLQVGGVDSAVLFKELYAPSAVAQADGATAIINSFLSGEL